MNQLVLDLNTSPVSAFDNFVSDKNHEVVSLLKQTKAEQFVYLWGESGSGKTHLLQAWCHLAKQHGKSVIYLNAALDALDDYARQADYLAVDKLDDLNDTQQINLFSIYNTFRQENRGHLLMAGMQPPMQMNLRDDLRTRLGWGLVFEVKALNDLAKLEVLRNLARSKQLNISDDIFSYLLKYHGRDLPSLIALIEALDNYSLAAHRQISIPLLKLLLKNKDSHELGSI